VLQTLESSLTYVTEHGVEVFAHDAYQEFFLAKALVDRLNQGTLSPVQVYNMLEEKTHVTDVLRVDKDGVTMTAVPDVNITRETTVAPPKWRGKTRSAGNRQERELQSCMIMPVVKSYVSTVMPFLFGFSCYENDFLDILLGNNAGPELLARCYVESSKDVSIEERVVDYLCSSLEGDSENFTLMHAVSSALGQVRPRDPNYVRRFFESDQRRLREIAAELVAEYDFENVKDMLQEYSHHDDWRVRWNAMVALGKYDTLESRRIIYRVLISDKCEQVSYKAASVLSQSEESRNAKTYSMPFYLKRLEDKDFDPIESQKARDEIGT